MQTSTPTATIHGATPSARAGVREWLALVVLMLPVLLVSIDNTALNFAVPDIARALQPTAQQQLWIIDAYPLVLAGLLVAMGALGDRIGRRKLLLIGAAGFAAVSVFAAFAPSAEALIAARLLLGFFGATLMPSTMSLLRTTFVDRNQRRLAIAIWATAFSAGSAIGPIVGGVLLAHFHWGAIFFIAVPVLVPLFFTAPFLVRESRDPNPGRIDIVSIGLSMAALGSLAGGIKHLATNGVDIVVFGLLTVAVVTAWGFVRRMLRTENPMLDVRLLAVPEFSGAILVNLLSVISLTGFLFFATQHLQLVAGLSVIDAALVLAPGVIAMVIAGLSVVWIVKFVRPGIVIPLALGAAFIAYAVLAFAGGNVTLPVIAGAFALMGAGIGAAETLSNDLIVSTVPSAKAGAASAVSETAYEFGAVLGTTLLGGVLTAVYRATLDTSALTLPGDSAAASETLGGAVDVAARIGGDAGAALLSAAQHAFDQGMVVTSSVGTALMAIAVVVAAVSLRAVKA